MNELIDITSVLLTNSWGAKENFDCFFMYYLQFD